MQMLGGNRGNVNSALERDRDFHLNFRVADDTDTTHESTIRSRKLRFATKKPSKATSVGGPRDDSGPSFAGQSEGPLFADGRRRRLTRLRLQLTVIRVPAWVPFTSCRRFPLGSYTLKLKVPL